MSNCSLMLVGWRIKINESYISQPNKTDFELYLSFSLTEKHTFFNRTMLGLFLILAVLSVTTTSDSNNLPSTYVIRRDLFNILKASQFSIYDSSQNDELYRLQSQYAFTQTIELVAQPSKKVVGKLRSQFLTLLYEGNITVLDPSTNQWINGKIKRQLTFFFETYIIEWNGRRISMTTGFNPFHTEFHDETNGALLARVQKRLISLVWTNIYDLEIFSDDVPKAIYILALAAHDHTRSQSQSSSANSKSSRKLKTA